MMGNTEDKAAESEKTDVNSSKEYWATISPTVNGMLGGFGSVSNLDIQTSKAFLQKLFVSEPRPGRDHALDCGAGIGRISKHLLLPLFDRVDMLEQCERFVQKAKEYIGPRLFRKVGNIFAVGLEEFASDGTTYDVIWIQWVVAYVDDDALVEFLKTCK